MKIRRILATAVAAAVTTPVVFLSAAPAFADEAPKTSQTQNEQPSIEQLRLAVAAAQTAYDKAVLAEAEAQKTLEALLKSLEVGGDNALAVASAEAKKEAETAAAAKTAADQAVLDAEAKLAAATTDEDKAAAQTALDEAKKEAATAATTKTAADAKADAAATAVDDARVAGFQELGKAQTAKADALKALKAAEKALAAAEAEEGQEPGDDCVEESKLKVGLTGPKKVVAGTSAVFTLRITNGTAKALDEVGAYAEAFSLDSTEAKDLDKYLDLTWSTAANPKWQDFDEETGALVGAVKAGGHADIKLRLTVDGKSPAGDGMLFAAGGYENKDGACGWSKDAGSVEFDIVAKGAGKPGTGGSTGGGNTNTDGQGGTSTTPVTSGGNGNKTTNGSLATTGANDSVTQIALAGGAALVLGAGAMFVVRRRKAGADA